MPSATQAEAESGLLELPVEGAALDRYGAELGFEDRSQAAVALAEAVAVSAEIGAAGAAFAVRGGESPRIGLFATLGPADWRWIARQAHHFGSAAGTLRYMDYAAAERLAESLAEAIKTEIGEDELGRWRLLGVPRGGLVVLGMLSYALGLDADAVAGGDWEGPLIVVDDCALTGDRFRRVLGGCAASEVVFAQLLSPPELRGEIERREGRVRRCLAAGDLEDCGPRLLGDSYGEWRSGLAARLGGDRYWVGCPEAVGFAWSEPDRLLWDDEREELRLAWSLLPPARCLARRSAGARVQVQAPGSGAVRLADGTLSAELSGSRLVGNLDSGEVFELSQSAAAMWESLLVAESVEKALDELERRFEAPRARLARDLADLTRELAERGFTKG